MSKVTVMRRMHVLSEPRPVVFESRVDPPARCCRCFPSMVHADGVCGCCEFNHATGERHNHQDHDFEDKP